MNLEKISSVLKTGTLVEIIIFIPGANMVTKRFGKVGSVLGNNLILVPHNNELIKELYGGGDIIGYNTIIDGVNIIEIVSLASDEPTLKELIKNNRRIN